MLKLAPVPRMFVVALINQWVSTLLMAMSMTKEASFEKGAEGNPP
jgi:hypothetical protein